MDIFVSTLGMYLIQLPVLIVWLVGGVLALVHWRRHPRVSLLALIALGVFFIQMLVGTYLSIWLPMTLVRQGMSAAQMGLIMMARGVVQSLVSAVAWALLIAAVFGWRSKQDGAAQEHA